jgi:glyoxylase-like metal-dependent hydrolase (beta-lactamase superfamily II)
MDLGGHRALLRHYGPAHAADDQVVLVDDRVLFTGDLVVTGQFPIVPYFPPFDADVDANHWIDVLDELANLQPTIVVPGYGEVSDSTSNRRRQRVFPFYPRNGWPTSGAGRLGRGHGGIHRGRGPVGRVGARPWTGRAAWRAKPFTPLLTTHGCPHQCDLLNVG